MRIFMNSFLIFLFPFLQKEGHYERHNQFCGGMNGSDIKWSLVINDNKTYSFQIVERKNEYLSKPKTTFLVGTWELSVGTLKLSDWAKKGDTLLFYKSQDRLMFLSDKSKINNRSLIYLDYLEQTKN